MVLEDTPALYRCQLELVGVARSSLVEEDQKCENRLSLLCVHSLVPWVSVEEVVLRSHCCPQVLRQDLDITRQWQ